MACVQIVSGVSVISSFGFECRIFVPIIHHNLVLTQLLGSKTYVKHVYNIVKQ